MVKSPQHWRALLINVVGSATEFPGAVYYLANSLSEGGVSIFHISTFESEVFLVREHDIEKACSLLRRNESPRELGVFLEKALLRRAPGSATTDVADNSEDTTPPFKEGFLLCVLPGHVMLARLNEEYPLQECSQILVRTMHCQ
jgi:hypothetical protein